MNEFITDDKNVNAHKIKKRYLKQTNGSKEKKLYIEEKPIKWKLNRTGAYKNNYRGLFTTRTYRL